MKYYEILSKWPHLDPSVTLPHDDVAADMRCQRKRAISFDEFDHVYITCNFITYGCFI